MPEPENNLLVPASRVTINMDLTKDDVVAIKISQYEQKIMDFEAQIQEQLEDEHKGMNKARKDAEAMLAEAAHKAFDKKGEAMLAAVSAMEDVPADKLVLRITASQSFSPYDNSGLRHRMEDEKDAFGVTIAISQRGRRDDDYHNLYKSSRTLPLPKDYTKALEDLKAADERMKHLQEQLAKARQTIAKMPSVERHCRAELAKQALKSAKREDVLRTLDNVSIPGLPADMAAVLSLPAPGAKPKKK